MTIDQAINALVTITLIVMMVAIGLGVAFGDLWGVVKNWRLVSRAAIANYVLIPASTVGLLLVFRPADSMVAVGFLILAVCPGAPFGPPCTKIARGNVAAAVGVMVLLAASSAIVAPLLLDLLLSWFSPDGTLHVDAVKMAITLLITQLLPLCVGLCVRHWWPGIADRIQKPANLASSILGLSTVALILIVQFRLLADIRLLGWIGMSALLTASWVLGWLLGGPGSENRKAMALTASLRNVGVGLVIAAGNFAGTAAVTAALAYGIFEILGSILLALWWGRSAATSDLGVHQIGR
jgi:bile acid:Na+ symporter, BASS family